ncbi:restriction endonuclease subunit S, partial [Rodentibacter pneumotropicus]|uniref:restriction endonuclease subunit S n=1 Tax=Rodentibacter pneumotropicus TaxID=758 RepID=UPI00098671B2
MNKMVLGDVVNFLNSKRKPLSSKERETKKGIYPYYGASDIVDYIDEFIFDGRYLLISEDGENLKTRKTPIAFIAEGKFWVNNHAHIVEGKDDETIDYLKFYFSQFNLLPFLTGAVQPKLSKGVLEKIEIDFPTYEKRKFINQRLRDIEQKIQLNTQISQTLEQITQAIFKSWFVDFDPVRAKADALADGKTQAEAEFAAMQIISGKTPEELTALSQTHPEKYAELAEIARAFPSEFEEVEGFGEVPRGWEVKTLSNLIAFVKGKKPKEIYPKQEKNMLPHILISSLEGKYNEYCQTDKFITVKYQDIIMVMDGASSGRIAIGHYGIIGSTLAKLSIKDNKFWAIIYQLLKYKEKDIQGNTTGTTIPHTDKNRVNNYQTIIPSNFILNKFNDFFDNSLLQIISNR